MAMVADDNAQDAPSPAQSVAVVAGEQPVAENTRKGRRRRRKKSKSRRVFYDPTAELDALSRRVLQIEIANGPGISAREIREIGGLKYDIDTINRRRSLGAYQRALEEFQKDAIQLIHDGQTKAIRKLLSQVDHEDPKVSQRAALFFAEASMTTHLEKAKAALALEMQNREIKNVKKTIVVFEMDDSIQVLGEPHVAAAGAPVASLPPTDATGSAPPQAERLPEPATPIALPPPVGSTETKPQAEGSGDVLTTIIPQESPNPSTTDLEKPVTSEKGSDGVFAVLQGQRVTIQVPNNTARVVDDSVGNTPDRVTPESPTLNRVELETDDDDIIGGIGD